MIILAILLITMNCSLCIILFVWKRRINSPFQYFYLLLLALGVFPSFYDLQEGSYQFHPLAPPIYISPVIIFSVHLKIAAMLLTFLLLEAFIGRRGRPPIELPKAPTILSVYDGMAVINVVFLLAGIYIYGFSTLANTNFNELRFGRVSTYSLTMFYLQVIIVGMPAVYWLKCNRKITALAILVIFLFEYLLIGGSRQTIIFSLASFLVIYLESGGRWTYVLLIILFSIAFSFTNDILEIAKALRNLPSFHDRLSLLVDVVTGNASVVGISSESSLRFVMYGFLHDTPPADFGHLAYFRRALLFWLPSFADLAGLKPADFEATMFAEAMGNREGTMHAIFFGSVYADAGVLFIVWVAGFVLAFRFLEAEIYRLKPLEREMVWSSSIYLSFMAARGSLYAPLVITTTVLLIARISEPVRALARLEQLRRNTSGTITCQ